jgi:hypothetical protein
MSRKRSPKRLAREIPRGELTLPRLPSLQTPLPVLSPDQPKAKPTQSKPAKLRKEQGGDDG